MYIIDNLLCFVANTIIYIFLVSIFYFFYKSLYKYFILQTDDEESQSQVENNQHNLQTDDENNLSLVEDNHSNLHTNDENNPSLVEDNHTNLQTDDENKLSLVEDNHQILATDDEEISQFSENIICHSERSVESRLDSSLRCFVPQHDMIVANLDAANDESNLSQVEDNHLNLQTDDENKLSQVEDNHQILPTDDEEISQFSENIICHSERSVESRLDSSLRCFVPQHDMIVANLDAANDENNLSQVEDNHTNLQTDDENKLSLVEDNHQILATDDEEISQFSENIICHSERSVESRLDSSLRCFVPQHDMIVANLDAANDENNLIVIADNNKEFLESTPQNINTQRPLASNRFAKVAFISTFTLVGLFLASTFLSQLITGINKPKKLQQQTIQTTNNLNKTQETRREAQNQLKTFSSPQPNTIATTPPKTVTRAVIPKVSTSAPTVNVPKIVTVEPVVQPQAIVTSKPIKPRPSISPKIASTKPPKEAPTVNVPKIVTVEPVVQPQSVVTSKPIKPQASIFPKIAFTKPRQIIFEKPKVESVYPQELEEITIAKEGVAPSVLNSPENSQENSPDTAANLFPTPASDPSLVNQPTSTLEDSEKSIAVGTSAKAVLATALFRETNFAANDNKSYSTLVIRLKQPLKNIDGTIALPENTELVAKIRSISDSGILEVNVISVIRLSDNKLTETNIPESAITIQAPLGQPLIANKYPKQGRSIEGMTTQGDIWFLQVGTEVEVYVNQPIQL